MTVILAAGALFTAVYDVIQSMDLSHTKIVTAATVDNTGNNSFMVGGTKFNGAETTTTSFTQGTWVIIFNGQDFSKVDLGWNRGYGAVCLAFYKGNSMTVQIGVGGGVGGKYNGSGKTIVTTNFALPNGYSGSYEAMSAGAGAGTCDLATVHNRYTIAELQKLMDGTFAGWTGDYGTVLSKMGLANINAMGTPACQSNGGWMVTGDSQGAAQTPNWVSGTSGLGGGAGYFDGGACKHDNQVAGGGSCTPWCYPLASSDIENGPRYTNGRVGERVRNPYGGTGDIRFYRIDPGVMPKGGTVAYGETVRLAEGGVGAWNPYDAVRLSDPSSPKRFEDYDCGIRAGWVYSVEKGGGWEGLAPDGERSETSGTHVTDNFYFTKIPPPKTMSPSYKTAA